MRTWLSLLGGLLVWAAHFVAAYAVASIAEIARPEHRQPLTLLFIALTIVCVLAASVLAVRAWRDRQSGAFVRRLSTLGAAIAAVAIAWQSTPIFWRY